MTPCKYISGYLFTTSFKFASIDVQRVDTVRRTVMGYSRVKSIHWGLACNECSIYILLNGNLAHDDIVNLESENRMLLPRNHNVH